MCFLCGTYSESFEASAIQGGEADGSGSVNFGGAGASGAPIGELPADRLYAVALAVNFEGMDRFVPSSNLSAPKVLSIRLETSTPADMPSAYTRYTLSSFTTQQDAAIRAVLADIETLINVDFVEASAGADADISIMRGNLESSYGGRGRFVYNWQTVNGVASVTNYDGFAIFNETRALTDANGIALLYHEIGHALTLRHPGNVDINPANAPPPPYLPLAEDNYKFSVMSYNASPEYAARPDSFMLYDVAALQYRFGANMSTRSGDTVYSTSSGPPDVIWDGGGRDRLDGSNYGFSQYLDLRQGAFSTLGSATLSDTVAIAFGAVIEGARGGGGNDTVVGNDVDNELVGNAGLDTLFGNSGADTLLGGQGADQLWGGAGNDLIWGGSENDSLLGEAGADILLGEDGADQVYGWFGNDTLYGWLGNDLMRGEQDNDLIFGEDGDDSLLGDDGSDTIHGGNGADLAFGWTGADQIWGGVGNDTLHGEQDNDTLLGNEGFDTIFGGDGADLAFGWTGSDLIWGGAGNDTLWGEQDNDTLLGETGDDALFGVDGNDVIYGYLGNDSLYGWTGDDVLWGEAGNDLMLGEDGADVFIGGLGRDTMTGGAGADRYFNAFLEMAAGEVDLVTDHDAADVFLFQAGAQLQYVNFNAPGYGVGAGIHVQVQGGVFIIDVLGATASQLQSQTQFF
jgi:serralysin